MKSLLIDKVELYLRHAEDKSKRPSCVDHDSRTPRRGPAVAQWVAYRVVSVDGRRYQYVRAQVGTQWLTILDQLAKYRSSFEPGNKKQKLENQILELASRTFGVHTGAKNIP